MSFNLYLDSYYKPKAYLLSFRSIVIMLRERACSVSASVFVIFLFIGSAFLFGPAVVAQPSSAMSNSRASASGSILPLPPSAYLPLGQQAFAFVSNFETYTLEGWQSIQGSAPTIVSSKNYTGEPSLKSSANNGSQIDFTDDNFVTSQSELSFQVAIHAPSSSAGYIGLASSQDSFVAIVGVKNGMVYAGASLSSLKSVEAIPKKTAYPAGWVYIIADLSNSTGKWIMQVFVDQTQGPSKQVSVPNAGNYVGALIETMAGTMYYTNIIFSTFQIANVVSGYHPMQGYGGRVASAEIVRLLPAYYNLTAVMTLNSFSVPESDILSFQINAQNYTAATQDTCVGFFQIGLFLDSQSGNIDPWYVPYGDCGPYSFPQGATLHVPKGEKIILSIVFNKSSHEIMFKEYYPQIKKTLSANISYTGGDFYSAYTQMEYQTSSSYPIQDYKLTGSIFGIQITPVSGVPEYLPAIYMMPFNLNAPTSWDVHYYVNSTAGYDELST